MTAGESTRMIQVPGPPRVNSQCVTVNRWAEPGSGLYTLLKIGTEAQTARQWLTRQARASVSDSDSVTPRAGGAGGSNSTSESTELAVTLMIIKFRVGCQ